MDVQTKTIPYKDFRPYMFIRKEAKLSLQATNRTVISSRDRSGSFQIEMFFEENDDYKNLAGDELVKLTWTPNHPKFAMDIRQYLKGLEIETYEGKVPHHHRYAVDCLTELPVYEMRKCYWDMEWMTTGKYKDMITTIVAYDSYDKEYKIFAWFPKDKLDEIAFDRDGPRRVTDYNPNIYSSEKTMLAGFLSYLMNREPDMLISWFGWKFDLPKLIHRMAKYNLDPRLISPFDEVSGVSWQGEKVKVYRKQVDNWSPTYQPIKGMITVPLELAFERQWNDSQQGTLPSLALDYVAESVLGEKKLVSEKFPDKNEFFAKAWLEDSATYIEYAKVDVELLVRIDEKNHLTEAILALQRLLVAPHDACYYASNMGGTYFMRNAPWKAPTSVKKDGGRYDGAMVYDPLSESTNGLHTNVAALDFKSLYPSMIIARNISWETKSNTPTKLGCNLMEPKDFSESDEKDMRYYQTDKLGILPKSLLELQELREEYKSRMRSDPDNYIIWNNNQLAVKRLMASFYGITAYQGFSWYDLDIAASITASAREAIRLAAKEVRNL
jgi:DNA polymerase elongation subunit (family B)